MPKARQGDPSNLDLKRRLRSEMTLAERRLWSRLYARQLQSLKFRRQHGIGPYIVDFYCPEKGVVIEVNGDSHADEGQILKDEQRESYGKYRKTLPPLAPSYKRGGKSKKPLK